jgi:tRNA nucleotidyltransferase (CCA-adding enzyme)
MEIYQVGGAVRDQMLGLPVKDHDYLVVGSSPEQMLAQGFLPVGKDFPVFLHPGSHDEYALARTERKTAPGYKGFVFHTASDVTLEQDLIRRDLTINAMARAEDGQLHDPFGGQQDLKARILRHVSHSFAEDPVRILRLARFAARFHDFSVAPETLALMQQMVLAGEVDALVAERVWQELERGLQETRPTRMFEVLRSCGALARLLPELLDANPALWGALDQAASQGFDLTQRFAVLLHQVESRPELDALCQRLRVPNDCVELAQALQREIAALPHALDWSAAQLLALLQRCDAWRRPERFLALLQASACIFDSAGVSAHLLRVLQVAQSVNAGAVAKQQAAIEGPAGKNIAAAIHEARIGALHQAGIGN